MLMRDVSSYRDLLKTYRGYTLCPDVFDEFWAGVCAKNKPEAREVRKASVNCSRLTCEEFTYLASDGVSLKAHILRPRGVALLPTVILYTDCGREVRGWLHLARFASLGFAVVAPEIRSLPQAVYTSFEKAWKGEVSAGNLTAYYFNANALDRAEDSAVECARRAPLFQLISDAYAAAHVTRLLPFVDKGRLMTWGEGLGGALALDTAALLGSQCAGVMAQNPFFADSAACVPDGFCSAQETPKNVRIADAMGLLDTASFAERITCPTLMACSLEDRSSLPEGTFAAYNRIPAEQKRMAVYPRHAHERINDFENLQINFLLTYSGGRL